MRFSCGEARPQPRYGHPQSTRHCVHINLDFFIYWAGKLRYREGMSSLIQSSLCRHQETEAIENPRTLVRDLLAVDCPRDDGQVAEESGVQAREAIYPRSCSQEQSPTH